MSDPPKSALEHFETQAANYEASVGGCTQELARFLLDIIPSFDASSSVLDNACGSGIVAQEILAKHLNVPMHITCTDGAPGMISLAKHAVPASNTGATLTFDVMPGEELKFPDAQFTHSITNLGILFFKDGAKGAKEIYRTLKPGGTAAVTSWKHLGYLDLVHQAQKAVKPNDPPFRIPISDDWYQASHLEKTLQEAGFGEVHVQEKKVYYAAESVQILCANLMGMFAMITQGWNEDEKAIFRQKFEIAAEKAVVEVRRPVSGGSLGEIVDLVGLPMIALVAVARK